MHWGKAVVGVACGPLAFFAGAGGSAGWAQTAPAGPPALAISGTAVRASGMSAGGVVVWLSLARKVEAYEPIYVRRHGVVQADAKGQAELPVTEAVPRHSIWLAVDLKTGAYATASLAGFAPLAFTLSPEALEVRGAALADRLIDTADYSELLLVRPGKGAWGKAVGHGGIDDESATGEAVVKVSFAKFLPVPGTAEPAPAKLGPKDLIIVMHPRAMAIAALTFEAKP
jgi:hypothetical protein